MRERGPPEMGMPPKTMATMMFMPMLPAVVAVTEGVYTSVRKAPSPTPIPAMTKAMIAYLFTWMPVSWAQTGLPPRNFCLRPILVKSKTKKQISQKMASTAILKPMLSRGLTSAEGIEMPPTAPPLVVMICAAMADSTLIMATVVTKTGM